MDMPKVWCDRFDPDPWRQVGTELCSKPRVDRGGRGALGLLFSELPWAELQHPLVHTRAERCIEEENFTSFAPSVDIEEWHKLHCCFFGQEKSSISSTTTTVALVLRLLSAPVTAWQLDNWRSECLGRSEGLGRLNFEDRPTMLWLRDEFALVADRLGSDASALGSCSMDGSIALVALGRLLAPS